MINIKNKTILVVDDHDDDRTLLKQLFESQGDQVVLANNGEVALEKLSEHDIDFVFSDVLMPIMDGLQLCKLIKSSDALKNIPVILYTSIYSNEEDMKHAIKVGADHYLIKPIEPTNILNLLNKGMNDSASKVVSGSNAKPVITPETEENYLRLYSTHLVERLEDEVEKLGKEIIKREKVEQEQTDILNSMIDGVITIDEKGKMLSFNKSAEKLFDYNAEDVIGKNVSMLMPKSYVDKHDSYLQKYLNTNEAHVIGIEAGREVLGLRKNKEIFSMRLLVAELPKDIDGQKRFIGSCQDLTYIKQQEEQLRRSQKMEALGKLTGGIAHDYNNMLGIMTGYAELLEEALIDQPKLAKYAQQINHTGQRSAKLTKKLLGFTRQVNSNDELLNINVLLKNEQHMLEKILTARINLTLNLGDKLWKVWLDNSDLEDAIINMSINAMHAMHENGELSIRTLNETFDDLDAKRLQLKSGDYVSLSISDNGCGIDELEKEKIFEPFYSSKGEGGTGLGLSQVYGFVDRSHGAIRVDSKVDIGTCFTLYFPRHLEKNTSDENGFTERESLNSAIYLSGTEKILVVDDEQALRELTSEILKLEGYQVTCAENAKQALECLEDETFDVLFSDVIMPDMDGFKLASIVQKKYPLMKIQLASGFSDERHTMMSENTLNENLLNKPYNAVALLKSIRELCNDEQD